MTFFLTSKSDLILILNSSRRYDLCWTHSDCQSCCKRCTTRRFMSTLRWTPSIQPSFLWTTEWRRTLVHRIGSRHVSFSSPLCYWNDCQIINILTVMRHRNVNSAISPCGICRQFLREFCSLDMPILLVPGDYPQQLEPGKAQKPGYTEGGVKETTLGVLLPDSFGPEHLELPRKSWRSSSLSDEGWVATGLNLYISLIPLIVQMYGGNWPLFILSL